MCLPAQLALGADLARHPGHLAGKAVQLIEHGIDGVGILEKFAFQRPALYFQRHVLSEHPARDRADHPPGIAYRLYQVIDQGIDGLDFHTPGTVDFVEGHALAKLAFGADDHGNMLDALGQLCVGSDDLVECIGDLAVYALPVQRQAHAEVAVAHGIQRFEQCHLVEGALFMHFILKQYPVLFAPVMSASVMRYGFLSHVSLLFL